MVYAYDQWAQMPVKDLFDTQMMLASVEAAKDMYEKGLAEMKDFRKEYGDFYTPFAKDMQAYSNIVGRVQDKINELYDRGIDPLRSAEGRAIITREINSIDPTTLNAMRANAKFGTAYLSALADLQAKGLYDASAEDMRLSELGIDPFSEFSTIGPNGQLRTWNQLSPIQFQTLKDATDDWYKTRQPHLLNKEDVESFVDSNGNPYQYDQRYEYTGFTDSDLMNIARNNTPGWEGSFWSRYYRKLAADKITARGGIVTPEAIENQLQRDIADSQQGYLVAPVREADKFKLEDIRYQNNAKIASIRRGNGGGNGGSNGNDSSRWTYRQRANVANRYMKALEDMQATGRYPRNAAEFYKLSQTAVNGLDRTTAQALLAGTSSVDQLAQDGGIKRHPISFGDGTLKITAVNQNRYFDEFKKNQQSPTAWLDNYSVENTFIRQKLEDFNDWLNYNHVSGYVPMPEVTVNWTTTQGYDQYDINGTIRVRRSDVDQYFKNNRDAIVGMANEIGMVALDKDGKRIYTDDNDISKNKLISDKIEYYDIPVTRTVSGEGFGNSQIDTFHDIQFTKSVAAKREGGYIEEDDTDFIFGD